MSSSEFLPTLSKCCYTMSESNLSGARVIIGFNTLEDAQQAHQEIVDLHTAKKSAKQIHETDDPVTKIKYEILMPDVVKAAFAAGMSVIYDERDGAQKLYRTDEHAAHYQAWNPLNDDGESRRLALALRISLRIGENYVEAWSEGGIGKIYRSAAFSSNAVRSIGVAARWAVAIVARDIGRDLP